MEKVKITRMQKNDGKWVVTSEESKPTTLDFYNNIMNDDNAIGSGTRATNNYCQWGKMDSKTFYSPSKTLKTVYKF